MGLMVVFKTLVFEWICRPLVTVVYPLYSSVQAIESSSTTDCRRWLMYWVLLTLFEVIYEQFSEWLPAYLPLITTFSLVFPFSDALAVYVYENAVKPCFNVLRIFACWSKIQYEELIVRIEEDRQHEKKTLSCHTDHNGGTMDRDAVTVTDEAMVTTTTNHVSDTGTNSRSESETAAKTRVAEVAAATCRDVVRRPESPDPNESKKEWTCDVCQVTTTCESNLKLHLNGKKHKAKEKERRAKIYAEYQKSVADKESRSRVEQKNMIVQVRHMDLRIEHGAKKEWTCALCQVTTCSRADLQKHLLGKKHKAKENERKLSKATTENQNISNAAGKAHPLQMDFKKALLFPPLMNR